MCVCVCVYVCMYVCMYIKVQKHVRFTKDCSDIIIIQ